MSEKTALHTKYRPKNLDEIIGHEKVVASLRGIVEKGKWPSAIAFFGPTSAGKTTLTHALVASTFGVERVEGHPDFTEINAADSKTIEDVRALISISQKRPSRAKRRFIFIDEAQGLLSNAQAAAAILKPLESPPSSTTWLIGSMDPAKFETTANGKAIANRCTQFVLKTPSEADLDAQARRILKGEEITYIGKEQRALIVQASEGQMRTLANLIQAAQVYHEGLGKKAPDKLSSDDIAEVLQSSQSDDVAAAVQLLTCVYLGKMSAAQRVILDIGDGFGTINKLLQLNWFVLSDTALKGQRHPKVWSNAASLALKKQIESGLPESATARIEAMSLVHANLSKLKAQAQAFAMPEAYAMSAFAFDTIQGLKPYRSKSKE